MAAKKSPRISLLMATGHNYRLFPGVKADLSTGSVGSSGHVVFAIRSFFFSHSLNRLLALPLSFPLSLTLFFFSSETCTYRHPWMRARGRAYTWNNNLRAAPVRTCATRGETVGERSLNALGAAVP